MVSDISKQVQDLLDKGWTYSADGNYLVKIEQKSVSDTRPQRVSRFGNRLFKVFDKSGNPIEVRARKYLRENNRRVIGHRSEYPDAVFAYDKKGQPVTLLRGKVIALRKLFGELVEEGSHIQVGSDLIPITRKEDRVEITGIPGISEDEDIDITLFYVRERAQRKELWIDFIYVYTFVSTSGKNKTEHTIEVHWETKIKRSEWDEFTDKTSELDYGRVSDIVKKYVELKDYALIYEEEYADAITEALDDTLKLKPRTIRSDTHIYDLGTHPPGTPVSLSQSRTVASKTTTLPDAYWELSDDDIAFYIG